MDHRVILKYHTHPRLSRNQAHIRDNYHPVRWLRLIALPGAGKKCCTDSTKMERVCLPAQGRETKSSQPRSYSVHAFEHNQVGAIDQRLIPVIDIVPAQYYAKIDIQPEGIHRSTHYEINIFACWPDQRVINLPSLTLIVRDLTPCVNGAAN